MAKKQKTDGKVTSKPKGNSGLKGPRTMLAIAAVLSLSSIAGGYFFARNAFKNDAEVFSPNFVDENTEEVTLDLDGSDPVVGNHEKSTEGNEAVGDSDVGHSDSEGPEGLLEFADLVSNIEGINANGQPISSFLKLRVMLVYLPEPGAKRLMVRRQPFIRDLFNAYIRNLTEQDVRGAIGVLRLKSELLKRARAATGSELPQEILITDLIVN